MKIMLMVIGVLAFVGAVHIFFTWLGGDTEAVRKWKEREGKR